MNNYGYSPYFSRYPNEHKDKGYTLVLAKPGLAEQASEFNEIQMIQRDYTERLGNALFQDGTIITGCTMHINGTQVTIDPGRIFLGGLIRETNGATLTINGSGTERIIASITTSIVTAATDSSLRDPAQGAENYGLEGADREKEVVTWAVVEGDSIGNGASVYTLVEGEVPKEEVVTEIDPYVTKDALAERTFDENGSYKVKGITLRNSLEAPESEFNVSDKVKVTVTNGKAYVAGYSITKPVDSSVFLRQSTTTRLQQSESHTYSNQYETYELSNGPIAVVNNMTCLVSVLGESHYGGSQKDATEPLIRTPVDRITRIYEKDSTGNVTRIYTEGRDYTLYNDQINWAPTGDESIEPANGTTYYVDYVYNKTMVRGTDYDIENEADTAYVKFLQGGDKPDENSRFYISYLYTLARRDLLILDADGAVKVIEGQPDKLANLITPYNGNDRMLELGYVDVFPTDALNNKIIEGVGNVVNYNSVRLTQENFYTMLQRIESLEDRIVDLDMERSLTEGEDLTSMNGYFTDNFKGYSKSDLSYVKQIDSDTTISYTACLDLDSEELTTAFQVSSSDLIVKEDDDNSYDIIGNIISAPYTENMILEQKFATGTMLVNPYASYGPMCQVILSPDKDTWYEKTYVETSTKTTTKREVLDSTLPASYVGSGNASYLMRTDKVNQYTVELETKQHIDESNVLKETAIQTMRVQEITVEGKAFAGNMHNIYCEFDGTPVSLTPLKSTVAGSDVTVNGKTVHTVNANDIGLFDAKFTIPEGKTCGKVEVTFTGLDDTNEEYTGVAEYEAYGTLLTYGYMTEKVVESHYQALKVYQRYYVNYDPLAQSFMLSNSLDKTLIALDLYFASKSTSRPVCVQVRNMVNGYPGSDVYAEVMIDKDDVNVPADPNVPVATHVTFNQPVICKKGTAYCFVVLSDSNAYSLYYAQLGQNLLGSTDNTVTVNPYAIGTMFSSSNAATWTAHQESDLKFKLYESKFTGQGEIIFEEARTEDITAIFVDVVYQNTANDGLEWDYRYEKNGSYTEWLPVDTLIFRELEAITDTVQLRARIVTNYTTSPFIDADRVSLRAFVGQKKATYISRHITANDFDEPYQALKISYQVALPTGASHKVYYQDTSNGDWNELKTGNNVTLETKRLSSEWTQYTWNVSKVAAMVADNTLEGVNFFKIRIDLETTVAYNRPRVKKLSAIFKFA